MAMTVCKYCGQALSDRAFSCPHCGAIIAPLSELRLEKKGRQGKAASIACMVLGLLALFSVEGFALLSIFMFDCFCKFLRAEYVIFIMSGYLLFAVAYSVLPIAFGAVGIKRGGKNGFNISGIVLGAFEIVISCTMYVILLFRVL